MSNAGGMSTIQRYTDMLAGNTVWNPWEPEGAFDALSTITVPSGGLASITFAGIPNTYKHLQIRAIFRDSTASVGLDEMYFRFNGDTGSNYAYHTLYGDGAAAAALNGTSRSTGILCRTSIPRNSTTANAFGTAIFDILDYANTSKNKTTRCLAGVDLNGSGAVELTSSLWMSTAAINSIVLTAEASANFVQYSQFSLYGVR
jgi:hypothetical protein